MKNKDLKRIVKEAICEFLGDDMNYGIFLYEFKKIAKNEEIDPIATDASIEDAIEEFVMDIKEHFNIY